MNEIHKSVLQFLFCEKMITNQRLIEMNEAARGSRRSRNRFKREMVGSILLTFFITISYGNGIIGVKKDKSINKIDINLPINDSVPGNTLGEQLWSAGHETGTQAEWFLNGGGGEFNSNKGDSYVSSDVARSGKHSLKMSINTTSGGGHATRNYRWSEIGDYKDLIFTQYVYFSSRIDFDRNNDWFNLIQTKGVKFAPGGAGTGPDQINLPHFVLGLEVRGGAGSGGANYLSLADLQKFWGSNPDVIWKAPEGMDLPVGKWVKIQMRIIQDRGDNGRILVWQDDILIIDTKFRNTLRPEVDMNMYSINAYADKTFPAVTNIYLDDLSINLPGEPKVVSEPAPMEKPQVMILAPGSDFTLEEGETVKIETAVTTDPRLDVTKVEFFIDEKWAGVSKTAPYDYSFSDLLEGSYQVKAKIWDSQGSFSHSEEISIIVLPKEEADEQPKQETGPEQIAELPEATGSNFSFGSSEPVIFEGLVFSAETDSKLVSGTSYTFSNPEASATKLYQQERNSPDLRLKVPVPNGIYTVVTYHNELWFGKLGPSASAGRRVFAIQLEGKTVKENLDLYRESNNNPLRQIFKDIEVNDGILDIRMLASENRATLSALSVIPQSEGQGKPVPTETKFQLALNTGAPESAVLGNTEFKGEVGSFDFYNSQSTYSDNAASEDVLFQTERHGLNLTYKIPVPNGSYVVRTYHNELWYGKRGPKASAGSRVFSISLEGKVVKNELDLFLESNNQPLELVFEEVQVSDGVLELTLEASANRATLSGLSIESTTYSSGSNLREKQEQSETSDFNDGNKDTVSTAMVSLYPNPAVDRIYLEGNSGNFKQFLIHDTLGNLLFEFDPANLQNENNRYLLPLKGAKEGIYLISIVKKDNSVERLRFMIIS